MYPAALDKSLIAKGVFDRCRQGLEAVDNYQDAFLDLQILFYQICQSGLADSLIFGASGSTFSRAGVNPYGGDYGMPGNDKPSIRGRSACAPGPLRSAYLLAETWCRFQVHFLPGDGAVVRALYGHLATAHDDVT